MSAMFVFVTRQLSAHPAGKAWKWLSYGAGAPGFHHKGQ